MRRISILIFLGALLLPAVSYGALMGGQFSLPLESTTRFSGMINQYYNTIVTNTTWQALLKTGFFMTLLWTILKLPVAGPSVWRGFAEYFFIGVLIAAPVWNGKAGVIAVADGLDYLTTSLITSMGGLDANTAGGGVSLLSATWAAEQSGIQAAQTDIADFTTSCYQSAVSLYLQQHTGATVPKPTDVALSSYYQKSTMPPTSLTMPSVSCDAAMQDIKAKIGDTAQTRFNAAMADMQAKGISNSLLHSTQSAVSQTFVNSNAQGEMFNAAVASSPTTNQLQADNQPWTLQGLAQGILSGRSTMMVIPRAMIVLIGQTTLFVFDYHIFQISSILKTFAAMGIALAFLWFMFFRSLQPMITALGGWMFANGMLIVATICRNGFYNQINTNAANVLGSIVGIKSNFNDALFSIAFLGVMSTVLAGFLTWKGVGGLNSLFMGHMSPSNFTSIKGLGKK